MHYNVRAKFNAQKAREFYKELSDGSITAQKPDGKEIVASMQRACIDDQGFVHWSEVCYCPTPLKHERKTVYDSYFTDLTTQKTARYEDHQGQPFMDYLRKLSSQE